MTATQPDMTETQEPHNISELNEFYIQGDSCDQDIFAEGRSNLLLVAGEHYNRRRQNLARRLRDYKDVSQEQKLRLTKNHTQKICKVYVNSIMSANPDVGFTPKDDKSLHDQKVADLDHSLWEDAKVRYNFSDLLDDYCDSFVQIGEAAVKVFFDPNLGKKIGIAQAKDVEGNDMFDEQGQPVGDPGQPVFSGEFVFDEIYEFNLLRPPECRDIRKSEWLCLRKMTGVEALMSQFGHDPDLKKFIVASSDETFTVFDATKSGYRKTDKEVMIREFYFRACPRYPDGYYFITTKEGILSQGPLPGGIYPIIVQPLEKIQTTPRGRSIIKTMRPYQAEINRMASKIAEHQITLGDDKIITQNSSKMSPSVSFPGVRTFSAAGGAPVILAGRSGAQYLEPLKQEIAELYQVMSVAEASMDTPGQGQMDPYTLLFRSAKQKKVFQRYIKRFESFIIEVVKTYLKLAKLHMSDEQLISAVGKKEQVNLAELRNHQDDCYDIKIEAQSADIDTKFGQQIILNHTIQYAGSQLTRQDIGKIMKMSPLGDFQGTFDDFTMDEDLADNMLLALDRGERPPVHPGEDHPYMIKRLAKRISQPDYEFLDPAIQANYDAKMQVHQQMEAANQIAIKQAEAGYIPTGGYLSKVDLWVTDEKGHTNRLELPSQSIEWLVSRMKAQQQGQAPLANLPSDVQAQLSNRVNGQAGPSQPPSGGPNGMGPPMANQGARPAPQGALNVGRSASSIGISQPGVKRSA